jgi:hypothetical protein
MQFNAFEPTRSPAALTDAELLVRQRDAMVNEGGRDGSFDGPQDQHWRAIAPLRMNRNTDGDALNAVSRTGTTPSTSPPPLGESGN